MPQDLVIKVNETTSIWNPESLMTGAEPTTLFQDVAREIAESGIIEEIRLERARDWAYLRHRVIGQEY